MDALRGSVRGRHVDLCRMSCLVWVRSMSVAFVGPHASMPDGVRLSGRACFCLSDLVNCVPASAAVPRKTAAMRQPGTRADVHARTRGTTQKEDSTGGRNPESRSSDIQ
eukprot:3532306-Prymnesium_polylepis.1